jgi:hypothetical protein
MASFSGHYGHSGLTQNSTAQSGLDRECWWSMRQAMQLENLADIDRINSYEKFRRSSPAQTFEEGFGGQANDRQSM